MSHQVKFLLKVVLNESNIYYNLLQAFDVMYTRNDWLHTFIFNLNFDHRTFMI